MAEIFLMGLGVAFVIIGATVAVFGATRQPEYSTSTVTIPTTKLETMQIIGLCPNPNCPGKDTTVYSTTTFNTTSQVVSLAIPPPVAFVYVGAVFFLSGLVLLVAAFVTGRGDVSLVSVRNQ